MSETICHEEVKTLVTEKKAEELHVNASVNPVLARLIEEVRTERVQGPHAYNRQHNRHNRSR